MCYLNFLLKLGPTEPTAHIVSSKRYKPDQLPVKVERALNLCFVYFITIGHFFCHKKIQYLEEK